LDPSGHPRGAAVRSDSGVRSVRSTWRPPARCGGPCCRR
jgi:hypothetical protein